MATQVALLAAIKILADGAKDAAEAIEPGQSFVAKVEDFENLIQDGIAAASAGGITELKAEIAALQPSDYVSLTAVLVADLSFSQAKAQAICKAALQVLSDEVPVIANIEALVAAAK